MSLLSRLDRLRDKDADIKKNEEHDAPEEAAKSQPSAAQPAESQPAESQPAALPSAAPAVQ